jgi:hypothetical protein
MTASRVAHDAENREVTVLATQGPGDHMIG